MPQIFSGLQFIARWAQPAICRTRKISLSGFKNVQEMGQHIRFISFAQKLSINAYTDLSSKTRCLSFLLNLHQVQCFVILSTLLLITSPEIIKLFPCSTLLSMKFILLINVKMSTIVGISMINTTSERLQPRNFFICRYLSFYEQLEFLAQFNWAWKKK